MASGNNRAKRLQETRWVRAKAPLAAQFEDCFQTLERLSLSLQANRPHSDDLRELAGHCTDHLRRWGSESGASSRALDHALKCSPAATQRLQVLLADLLLVSETALTLVRPRFPDPDADNPSDSADPGDDEDVDLGPETHLKEIFDIIGCLWSLLPILRAPLDDHGDLHVDSRDMDTYSAAWYVQTTFDLFPQVPGKLAERLGHNNWRRRQYLLHLGRRSQVALAATGAAVRGSPSQRRVGAPSLARKRGAGAIASSRQSSGDSVQASHSDSSTSVSGGETQITSFIVSTGPHSNRTSTTSSHRVAHRPPAILERLVLPEPPERLDKEFYCPYCYFALPLTVSVLRMKPDEWIDHVYLDLKPYMCTFMDCTWGDIMFGTRQEWFRHELDCHRTRVVWSCGGCRLHFGAESAFVEHIADSHPQFGVESLPLVADACKRYLTESPCLDCHLCGQTCDNLEHLEDHIGGHLELLALAATLDHDLEAFDDTSSDGYDNINEYFDQMHDAEEEPPAGGKTLRAGSPGRPLTGSRVTTDHNSSMTQQNIIGLEKEMKKQKIAQAADEKVRVFLSNQGDTSDVQSVRCNIPERNSTFLGRDDSLGKIHGCFSISGWICTISGRGGIGKTATAIEYLHRHSDVYKYIFWVDAENPGTCQEKYNMIASDLEKSGGPAPEGKGTAAVRDCLVELEQRWLLVFDNVKKWADIARYVPNRLGASRGSVLITSQLPSDQLGISSWRLHMGIQLEPWSLDHSREFLLTSLSSRLNRDNLQSHDEYDLAEKVVNAVEGLPLAVSIVVGYIKVTRCSLAEFLGMWAEQESSRRRPKRLPSADETFVDRTIDSLWEIGIREVPADCSQLLDVMSFFNPDNIPKSLLVGDHEEDYLAFLHSDERFRYKRMIETLRRQRLISTRTVDGEETYNLHRVLKLKIQLYMDDYTFDTSFRKAFRLIRKAFPRTDETQVPVPSEMEICKRYMPHLDSFYRIYKERAGEQGIFQSSGTEPRELAKLFYDAGFYVYGGQSTAYDGFPFIEMAEKILDEIGDPPDTKIRADIHCVTGLLHLYTDGPARTKGTERLKKAWDIRQKIYIEDGTLDNDVLSQNAANDYSVCLMNAYEFDEVDDIITGCFKRYQMWGPESENPFEYSKYYGNYSAVLLWQGKIGEAIYSVERSLELTQKFSGRGPAYYRRLFWLACILLQAGDVQAAFDKHLDILNARLELHGKHHENTLLSLYAVAATYHHLGDLPNAIEHMQMCIKSALSSRWSAEALGRAQYHLAILFEELGEAEKADEAKSLKEKGEKVLEEFKPCAPAAIRESGDNMMIFDDMQSTFWGRYTGRKLLKFMQEQLKAGQK